MVVSLFSLQSQTDSDKQDYYFLSQEQTLINYVAIFNWIYCFFLDLQLFRHHKKIYASFIATIFLYAHILNYLEQFSPWPKKQWNLQQRTIGDQATVTIQRWFVFIFYHATA